MNLELISEHQWLAALGERPQGDYHAMYSSIWNGIVTDPKLMIIPIDDHMVHRGDGIFEAFRMVDRAIYDLDAHLDRLEASASQIGLKLPFQREEVAKVCCALGRLAPKADATFRLFVSRGGANFSPNPYDSKRSHLHVLCMPTVLPPAELYERGGRMALSKVAAKLPPYSLIKSCNYLQNVLMKKEIVDRGLDFAISVDESGKVYEGPTENVAFIDSQGRLLAPKFDYTLRGTTLLRVMELARSRLGRELKEVIFSDVSARDLKEAEEIFVIGTTLGVMPISEFEGSSVGSGKVGAKARLLRELLDQDMKQNSQLRLRVSQ